MARPLGVACRGIVVGKQYFWLGGNQDFSAGANWFDSSTGMTGTVPSSGDIAMFISSYGGTLSGTGSVDTININSAGVGISGVVSAATLDVITNTLTPGVTPASLTIDGGRVAVNGYLLVADALSYINIVNGGYLSATGARALVSFGRISLTRGTLTSDILQEFNSIVAQRGTINIATSLQMATGALDLTSSSLTAQQVYLGNTGGSNTTGTWNAAVADLGSLIVGNLGTASITVTGGSAIVTGDNAGLRPALAVGSGGSGTLYVSGASSLVSEGNSYFANAGTATVTVETSGTVTIRGTLTEASNSSARSSLTVTDTGSLLTIDNDDIIGSSGRAVDQVLAGGSLHVGGTLTLAGGPGAGTLTVSGAGSNVSAAAGAIIGKQGGGALVLSNGATVDVSGGLLSLAQADTASGTITLSGAATLLKAEGGLTVGQNSNGNVVINAGAVVDTVGMSVFVGDQMPGIGTITVTGAGAQLKGGTGANAIGYNGTGTLLVSNQGTADFQSGFLYLGYQATASGSIDVNGSQSYLSGGNFEIGRYGHGALSIAGTAYALAQNKITVGEFAGSVGSIDVTGGGTLVSNGDLSIGESGAGTINVNTGRFSVLGDVTLGLSAGGSGTLSLISSGLRANVLTIGAAGSGTILVGDNTKLRALSIQIGANGGTGTLTLDGAGSLPPLVQADGTLAIGGTASGASGTGLVSLGSATVTAASIAIWNTGTATLAGGTLGGGPVQSSGTVSGHGTIDGAVTNTGTVLASGGLLIVTGAIDGAGALNIVSGGTLELQSTTTASQHVNFSGGTLKIDALSGAHAVITGFGAGDTIDIVGIAADGADFAGSTLDLTHGGAGVVGLLSVSGGYVSSNFHVATIGGNTTEVTYAGVACFAAGTRIATPAGPRAVEDLVAGDLVLESGGPVPITWIGQRLLSQLRRHPAPEQVQPILIEADALTDGVPLRDLLVSPDHALFLQSHLIPAKCLLNGATIRQLDRASVHYFHIELPRHGILLAEGVPAESYLETGNRGAFANGGTTVQMHPDFAPATRDYQAMRESQGCYPFATNGPAVAAARATILARAAIATTRDPALTIRFESGAAIIESRSDIHGDLSPDPGDRRRLGIKIAALSIAGRTIPLDHEALTEGWHTMEPQGRWTNGRAVIPQSLLRGQTDVQIHLAATRTYRLCA